MNLTLFDLAQRCVGEIAERPGGANHPAITWAFELTTLGAQPDEVPWCSAWINLQCWLLRLPRSKQANARSWLDIGRSIPLTQALPRYDVVILKRGLNPLSGHVTVFAGLDGAKNVRGIGGNQSNNVTIATFPRADVLGVRRLSEE